MSFLSTTTSGKKTRVWATSISLMAAIGLVHGQGPVRGTTYHHTRRNDDDDDDDDHNLDAAYNDSNDSYNHLHNPHYNINNNLDHQYPLVNYQYLHHTDLSPTSSTTPSVGTSSPGTSNTASSNLPVIVGSVAGAAALIIIIATAIICLRRRRRNNRDLSFDVLQGMNSGSNGGGTRQSQQRYRASTHPTPSLPTNNINTYDDDDDYDYNNQVGAGQGYGGHHQMGYDDTGYDAYGAPHHTYHQNPSIFQEDSMAYSTSNALSARNRQGYDQNLPEIVYRNGNDLIHPSGGATGYYEDDLYSQQLAGTNNGWDHQNAAAGGYIGPKGLWIANPTTEKQYQQQQQQQQYQDEMELQPPLSSSMTYEKNSITQYDSDTAVDSSSPPSKFRGHNPQALPESPRLQQLRGGDLFGQDGGSPTTPTSPRSANATASADPGHAASPTPPPPTS
ncbi:hypothetical protein BGZ97_008144, partial [Linnemannia gamsii]